MPIDREKMDAAIDAAMEVGPTYPAAMQAIYRAGVRAGMQMAKESAERTREHYSSLISKGKGDWPKPEYVQDEVWNRWQGAEVTAQSIAADIAATADALEADK